MCGGGGGLNNFFPYTYIILNVLLFILNIFKRGVFRCAVASCPTNNALMSIKQKKIITIQKKGRNIPPTDVFPFPLTLKSYSSGGYCVAIQYYHPWAKRLPRARNPLLFLQAWCSNMHLKLKAACECTEEERTPRRFDLLFLFAASVSSFWSGFCVKAIEMLMCSTLLKLCRQLSTWKTVELMII